MSENENLKIVHICLAGSYNDGWSYHDNLLSEYHKKLGYDVTLITTPFVNATDNAGYDFYKVGEYVNEYGIKIIRLPQRISNKSKLFLKLRSYRGTEKAIEAEHPDILFVHCGQFYDIRVIIKYVRRHPNVKLFIDNHADFSNSARTWFSYHIMHRILWRSGIRKAIPYTRKFYGVLPARVEFLVNMYGIPKDKVELLVMGADDELVTESAQEDVKSSYRKKYNVNEDDFVVVTGGKIDMAKQQIYYLLQAIQNIDNPRVKLVMFGPIVDEMKDKVMSYVDGRKIQYFPWLDSKESYGLFAVSDLAVFPGRHSVYWEQAVGSGIPIMVKWWEGTTHVDLGSNCIFLREDSTEIIQKEISGLITNPERYNELKKNAELKGKQAFSYLNLAKRSIEIS